MRIILVHHAEALSRRDAGVPYDAERPLSPAGKDAASRAAGLLQHLGVCPAAILSSPFIRAQQTARLLAESLCPETVPQPVTMFAPGCGPDEMLETVASRNPTSSDWTIVVMHEPDVSYILAHLLDGTDRLPFTIGPADCCGLTIHRHSGCRDARLAFYFAPSHLNADCRLDPAGQ